MLNPNLFFVFEFQNIYIFNVVQGCYLKIFLLFFYHKFANQVLLFQDAFIFWNIIALCYRH
jgi:hypothetical protein